MISRKYADTVLLALFALIAILLAFAVTGAKLTECFTGAVVSDWIRTVATASGFLLALCAYMNWRRPDDARRRADTAQEILRLSRRFEAYVLRARVPNYNRTSTPSRNGKLVAIRDAYARKDDERIKEMQTVGYELYALEPEAAAILTSEIAAKLTTLYDMFERADSALFYAGRLPDQITEEDEPKLDRIISGLGVRLGPELVPDEFVTELQAKGNDLRAELLKYLVAKTCCNSSNERS